MSYILTKLKDIFEKVKPVLMSETIHDSGIVMPDPENKPENMEMPAIAGAEIQADQPSGSPQAGTLNIMTALLNGAGVGLLLGTLLGLSISPVVSGVIGTLSGLLAVLLGISEKYMSPLKSVRIGAFGFFCVAGILLGMYIRINKGLLPSRQKMMTEYVAVGFSQQEARDFIAYREFGLIPSAWTGQKPEDPHGAKQPFPTDTNDVITQVPESQPAIKVSARQFANPAQTGAELNNVLYSSEINATECYKLNLANSSQPVSVIKNTFARAGGTWKELAVDLHIGMPDSIYIQALFAIRDCFCQTGQSGMVKVSMNETIRKAGDSQSLEQIKKLLSDAGGTWKTIGEKIGSEIPVGYQKSLLLAIIKIFRS